MGWVIQMRELGTSDIRWVSGGYDSWQVDLNNIQIYGDGNNIQGGYDWDHEQQTLDIDIILDNFNTWLFTVDSDIFDLIIQWVDDIGEWDVSASYSTDLDWIISTSTSPDGTLSVTATYGF
jgi:hypothetical protein